MCLGRTGLATGLGSGSSTKQARYFMAAINMVGQPSQLADYQTALWIKCFDITHRTPAGYQQMHKIKSDN